MRRASIASLLLIGWMGLTSCHNRGIIQLSRSDTQRCYNMLAKDGELLTAATSALGDYVADIPATQTSAASTRALCADHLAAWDQFVKELYEKYGVREGQYRLDVFGGRFMPILQKSESTKE
jgi:hypothetical protein